MEVAAEAAERKVNLHMETEREGLRRLEEPRVVVEEDIIQAILGVPPVEAAEEGMELEGAAALTAEAAAEVGPPAWLS